jgi:hypothetical protein
VNLGIHSGRFRLPPEGLFGGQAGAKARFLVNDQIGNPTAGAPAAGVW